MRLYYIRRFAIDLIMMVHLGQLSIDYVYKLMSDTRLQYMARVDRPEAILITWTQFNVLSWP